MSSRPVPDAAMRARIDALDPPVTAEMVAATKDKGAWLLVDACEQSDLPRAWALLEAGADAGAGAAVAACNLALFCAVSDADDAALVALLVAHGADAAGWRNNEDDDSPLLHYAQSAAVARALLAAGCDAHTRSSNGMAPLHNGYASPAALRVLVEEGGAGADVWARDNEGRLPLHAHVRDVAKTETLLALMLQRPPAGLDTAAAVNARNKAGNTPLASPFVSAGAAALLLACGADVRAVGLSLLARYGDALQVVLAHAAATLPGATKLPADALVQHARDSAAFAGRVAAWERERRARIDKEHAKAVDRLQAEGLTETQRAQRVLLLDEKRARRLADVEESLAAWARARLIVETAIATGPAPVSPPPLPTFAAWLNARDAEGRTALRRALELPKDGPARLLLRYGARVDGKDTLKLLLVFGPAFFRAALTDCGATTTAGFVLDRACVSRAAAAAAAEYAGLPVWQRERLGEPDAAQLLATFDECLKVRVKRISAGLQHAVPLSYRSASYCPLDIVSGYLGFSLVVGPPK